jgi:hypothetical protein
LRTLLVLLTIAAVWLAVVANRAREQLAVVARIEQLGGTVWYDWEYEQHRSGDPSLLRDAQPRGPRWLRRLIGPEYFQDVVWVVLDETAVTDGDLRRIGKLRRLQLLSLNRTCVSDAGLRELRLLTELRSLGLAETNVTGEGLQHLIRCKELQILILDGSAFGDAGVRYISQFRELHMLALGETHISSAAVEPIGNLEELQFLSLSHTAVDDAAVRALQRCASRDYSTLCLSGTRISARGQRAIHEALAPNSEIWESDIFDVEGGDFTTATGVPQWGAVCARLHLLDGEHRVKLVDLTGSTLSDDQVALLHGLKHVELIDFRGAKVSDEAVRQLRNALPHCEIDR